MLAAAGPASASRTRPHDPAAQAEARLLSAGDLRAELRPESGGRIGALWLETPSGDRRDILVPMQGPVVDALYWPKAGCYPLIPFSNRIRQGRFVFGGETVELPAHPSCAPHALHGFAQLRPWSLQPAGAASAAMSYRHRPDEWPWAFEATQRLSLDPRGLSVEIGLTNLSDRPMPAGLGLHPYFAAGPGDRIRFEAQREWEQDEAGCGVAQRQLGPDEARHDAALDREPVTRYFAGWSGVAQIAGADGRVTTILAGAPLDHFVFHVPPGGLYACMEPVSHVADAFNLAAAGLKGAGFMALAPGREVRAQARFEIDL